VPSGEQARIVLTASPLQRIGAFALAAIVAQRAKEQLTHPEKLAGEQFLAGCEVMTADLAATAKVGKSSDAGGFWLGASYLLWPNSKMNPTSRGKLLPGERTARIRLWRECPQEAAWPDVPCAYCDRRACGWFGKVDIPLAASHEYRNTTAPGHLGTPLCYPCVVSLWAFPYGADLSGGRATAIHSWDDTFLGATTGAAVRKTSRAASLPSGKAAKPGPYARERMVLTEVRGYSRRIEASVELLVLSNSNKEQFLRTQRLTSPIAEWLRTTVRDADGYRALVSSQAAKDIPGEAYLARRLFARPESVFHRVTFHLVERVSALRRIPQDARHLKPIVYSYCRQVLTMDEKDFTRITALGDRLAHMLAAESAGKLTGFIHANSKGGQLDRWLRRKSIDWLTVPQRQRPADAPKALVSAQDCRLLFDSDRSWSYRRLLMFAVIEGLAERDWQPRGTSEEIDAMTEAASAAAEENEEN
jgi:hypothetical protein